MRAICCHVLKSSFCQVVVPLLEEALSTEQAQDACKEIYSEISKQGAAPAALPTVSDAEAALARERVVASMNATVAEASTVAGTVESRHLPKPPTPPPSPPLESQSEPDEKKKKKNKKKKALGDGLDMVGDIEEEDMYERPVEAIMLPQKGAPKYVVVKEQPCLMLSARLKKKATNMGNDRIEIIGGFSCFTAHR